MLSVRSLLLELQIVAAHMLEPHLFVSFVVVSAALIVVPGPNVLLVIATSLTHGRASGFATIAGSLLAMSIQLVVAVIGTSWLAAQLADAFAVIKWLGVVYLVCLGAQRWRVALSSAGDETITAIRKRGSFWRGFFVALTNPKTIVFFGAFLPQFTAPSVPLGPQLATLALTFIALALVLDSMYAILAGGLRHWVQRPTVRRLFEGAAGTLFIGSGVGLAFTRRL
ncbi:MAG: LysE family translocator [Pseudomonadota bacterium]